MSNTLVGDSERIREVQGVIQQASRVDVAVLIHGESGTGKSLVAHLIHEGSGAGGSFINFDCDVGAPSLLEFELFGHQRGGSPEVRGRKPGMFESANHGTLFLEHVEYLPPSAQGRLLHVLQDRRLSAGGEPAPTQLDARVIAATDQDLERVFMAGGFREDLYYCLNIVRIEVAPLRERGRDVVLLAEHFLTELSARCYLPLKWFTADAQAALMRYRWPGNVRELRSTVERAALSTDAPAISVKALGIPRG